MDTILVVCVGNICRSPMAAAILKSQFPEKEILSAGLAALVGSPADPMALEVAARNGVDLSAHRAQQLSTWMCDKADLILVMEAEHKRVLEKKYPSARGKIYCLGHYGEGGLFEVEDPYRRGSTAFETAYSTIDRGTRHWIDRIGRLDKPTGQPTK